MSDRTAAVSRHAGPSLRWIVTILAVVVVLVAMGLDTRVVKIGSDVAANPNAFSPEEYGAKTFPQVKASIEKRAVPAKTLAEALAKDKAAAVKQYGVPAGTGPVFPVKFTGTVGKGEYGIYDVKVDGLPSSLGIRVQTGPAINGTELRDSTGTIKFGQFVNQIQYQDAGSAINNAMKKQVLSKIDNAKLTGKTISVVGAFLLINPENWLVTPVEIDVK